MLPLCGDKPAPGVQFFVQNHKSSVHSPIFFNFLPSNDILTIFLIEMHGLPMLTLPKNRSRSSPRHDLYNLCRAPLPYVSDAKFQNHWQSGSGEEDFRGEDL